MAVSISQISFEHHRDALGIHETKPRISWRFEGNYPNWTQRAYSLEISRPGIKIPENFLIKSPDSVLVPWPTVQLNPGEAAVVRARALGNDGQPNTEWSKPATVEIGLLTEEDWMGAMPIGSAIGADINAPKQGVYFRKEFAIDTNIQSARLYITAFGMYEAEINGKRVGDAVLAPGWQSYSNRHVYDTYDITKHIKRGNNVVGFIIGEGWYSGRFGFNGGKRNIWGDPIGALALLAVTYENGTKATLPSDLTWKSTAGPIISSNIYDGETYDSRLELPGWSTTGYNTASWTGVRPISWPKGRLVAADGPPIRRVQEKRLENVINTPSGKIVLDFGQNLVGWVRLSVQGPNGTTITLKHAEVMEKGEIATAPLRTAKATDVFILNGKGVQTWEPRFTYHGFRYVQVEGWPQNGTTLDSNAVTAVVVHSDMEQTGFFECSNELFTKLWTNIVWSMKGNHLSVPTDCPQRDERMGWTGDANAFAQTANFLYDTSGFVRSWLKDLKYEQLDGSNIPPFVVPEVEKQRRTATAVWGDVAVFHPWNAYLAFGDLDMLEEQYTSAKAWIDFVIPRNKVGLWKRDNYQYGDWLDPLAPYNNAAAATTSATLIADAYLVGGTELLANMAAALNRTNDAEFYRKNRTTLATEFQRAWILGDGTVANETQTGLTLPLYFSLFANQEQYNAAAKRLRSIIERNSYKVGTGFAGTHLLGLTMTKINETSTFYKMLSQTGVPSWLYQVVMGGTTTWERWDSMLPDRSINPSDMTSFNHYAFGSIGNWMHRTIGGLSPATPGWKRITVAPIPGANLTSAQIKYVSAYGTITSKWRITDTGFYLAIDIPPNTSADVHLPGMNGAASTVTTVGSGKYEFFVPGVTSK